MRWQLTELLTQRGTKIVKPKCVSVSLQTNGATLHAFGPDSEVAQITPHSIEFSLDSVIIKGICKWYSGRYIYQEWWLRPEKEEEDDIRRVCQSDN